MASNYPPDPKYGSSVSNPATPQSGPGGTLPDIVFGQEEQNPLPSSSVSQSSPPAHGDAGGNQRRLAPGTELSAGRYKIEKLEAAGGMGAVYRAIDTRLEGTCAVKEMLDDFQSETERSQAVDWFKREAKLLLNLNHPCIPRVRDFFVENGKHYLVMDFIDGRTLGEVLENEGNVIGVNGARGVSEARGRSWAQQICNVLGYLHRQSPPIIFRDLKPSNIMVTALDEIKLIDFGIARTFQSQRQSTIIMTVGYAPMEQLHGMPEPRSDLYALGATLHRVLTRHDAVNNKPTIFSFPPVRTLRPDISIAFEQIISKALAPLDQRWLNAIDMERTLINLPPVTLNPTVVAIPPQGQQRLYNPQTPGSVPGTPSIPPHHSTTGPGGASLTAALGYIAANRIEEAHAVIQQAYVLEPNNSLVHRTFGLIFARRQPPEIDRALRAYNNSLRLNPHDAETHKLLGDVSLFLRRQPAQAISAYTQSLRLNPNDLEAHQRLGQCYEETAQLEPALREFQEAARLAPKQAGLHLKVGQIALRMNQLLVAERAFVSVLTLNPADHSTRFLLSQVYETEGKLLDAERECSYVISLIPAAQPMLQRIRGKLGR